MAAKRKLCTKQCKTDLARQERDHLISMIETYYSQFGLVE